MFNFLCGAFFNKPIGDSIVGALIDYIYDGIRGEVFATYFTILFFLREYIFLRLEFQIKRYIDCY